VNSLIETFEITVIINILCDNYQSTLNPSTTHDFQNKKKYFSKYCKAASLRKNEEFMGGRKYRCAFCLDKS
jgi:hypothetical protein